MDKYYYQNKLVAIRITRINRGSIPITESSEPLQLVTLRHSKGVYLKAHMHKPKQRMTSRLQECLIVKEGMVKIDLYGPDRTYFKSINLRKGRVLILLNGGYGIHLSQDSELVEVKNGPFIEDKVLI